MKLSPAPPTTGNITIARGLPTHLRATAAQLYYEAFKQKLGPLIGAQAQCLALLERDFDPRLAFVALDHEGKLAGLAGLQYHGEHFVAFKLSSFVRVLGFWRGLLRYPLLLLLFRLHKPEELQLDGIIVHPEKRGQGIGSRLLKAIDEFAREESFSQIRLDVVNTNPQARRLYERVGYVPVHTESVPSMQPLMGFSAYTTMLKDISPPPQNP